MIRLLHFVRNTFAFSWQFFALSEHGRSDTELLISQNTERPPFKSISDVRS